MRNKFAGIAVIKVIDERLELRTWQQFNPRWHLDGKPVSERERRDYLRTKRRAAAKARRTN